MANIDNKILNFTSAEVFSFLSIIGVGYAFIYKFSYFYSLGVPWYLNNISPLSIIISSMIFISVSILGVLIGFFLGSIGVYLDDRFNSLSGTLVLFLFLLISALLSIPIYDLFNLSKYFDFYLINLILFMTLAGFISTINIKLLLGIDLIKENIRLYTIIGPIAIFFVTIAFLYGNFEAQKATNNPNKSLNTVVLNNDMNKWYLIDYMGDKVLIMKEGEKGVFKIVEYKEIKQFKTPNIQSN
jgi:hypothetical protein